MDYEYAAEEEDYAPRILWGRIGVFGGGLLIAFIFGACTFGGGDTDELEDQIVELTARNTELEERNASLETQNQNLSDRLSAADDDGDPDGDGETTLDGDGDADNDTGTGTDDGNDVADGEDREYVVQQGDTLRGIAQRFYGDANEWERIAEANGTDGSNLGIGDTLIIPGSD